MAGIAGVPANMTAAVKAQTQGRSRLMRVSMVWACLRVSRVCCVCAPCRAGVSEQCRLTGYDFGEAVFDDDGDGRGHDGPVDAVFTVAVVEPG